MTYPLVSVVIPTHNRPDLLTEAILSLDRQTYPGPIEVIIADDASSLPITSRQLPTCRFETHIVRNTCPQGGAAAKNLGAGAARGEYLAFLDDDDLLSPGYVEDAIAALRNCETLKICFMAVKWFGERAAWGQSHHDRNTDLILSQTEHTELEPNLILFTRGLFQALLERIPMPFQRPVLRRSDFQAIGNYQEDCLLWDCEWALRAALYGPCALLRRSPYLQRASGQGYSSQSQRQEEHLLSMIVAKQRLLHHPLLKSPELKQALSHSLSQGWFDAAYFYSEHRKYRQALQALRKSMRSGIHFHQIKLLAKISIYAFTHP
jgi:glycosyltransferase involved in cell wall biosynthesis